MPCANANCPCARQGEISGRCQRVAHPCYAAQQAGHDAVRVGEDLRLNAPDHEILAHAALHDRVTITADTDFGELLARQAAESPSMILFRRQTGRRPAMQAALVLEHLPDIQADLEHGAVVVIEERRVRVRRLPIDPEARNR